MSSSSQLQPRTAFIAGATGYTGRAVVQLCAGAGVRTVAHVRPDSAQRSTWEQRFTGWGAETDATPWELDALARRLDALRPTHVFALLGTTQKRAQREGLTDQYMQVDYGLTAILIDAARALPDKPRFIYLSAAGAGPRRGAYAEARYKAETKLRESGLPHVIARPGLITGEDREENRPLEQVAAAVCKPVGALLQSMGARRLAAWVMPITGTQLAQAIVREALEPQKNFVVLEPADLHAVGRQPAGSSTGFSGTGA